MKLIKAMGDTQMSSRKKNLERQTEMWDKCQRRF